MTKEVEHGDDSDMAGTGDSGTTYLLHVETPRASRDPPTGPDLGDGGPIQEDDVDHSRTPSFSRTALRPLLLHCSIAT